MTRAHTWTVRRSAAVLAAVASSLSIAAVAPSGCACTEVACSSGVAILVDVSLSFDDLKKGQLTMCRNSTCLPVDLSKLGQPPTAGTPAFWGSGTGNPEVSVLVSLGSNGGLSLSVSWSETGSNPFADGDSYSLTVLDSSGATVISDTETAAAYQVDRPNGQFCAPVCQRATFDRPTS